MSAFLGVSVQKDLDEQETLDNGYIQNAVILLAFKLDDAGMLEGKDGAAQKFIDKFIDSVGTHAFRDVEDLKDLLKRLESEIKENYKPSDEIQEWQSELDLASSAVEVYCQGWQVCVCVPDFQSVCVCVCHSVWTCIAKDVRPWPKSTQL
jgi:hypothetical protein